MFCHEVTMAPEAMIAAAAYVRDQYVSSARLTVETVLLITDVAVFHCSASDGSEWQVISDRYGNVTDVRDGESITDAAIRGGVGR
jgi:hypothetical protein